MKWMLIKAKNSLESKDKFRRLIQKLTFIRANRRPERKMLAVRSTFIDAADVFFSPTFVHDDHLLWWP